MQGIARITDATAHVKKYPNLAFLAENVPGVIIDAALGGFLQLHEDSIDPRFSNTQRVVRVLIAGGGSGFTGAVTTFGVATLCGATPVCIGVGIVGGVGAAFGFDAILKPRVFQRLGLEPVDSLEPYNP